MQRISSWPALFSQISRSALKTVPVSAVTATRAERTVAHRAAMPLAARVAALSKVDPKE
jgi:hypothetical protein